MRKKVLSLLCVLALCLGLLPVTALAAGEDVPNVLCVGTTNIGTTSYNDNAAYWTSEDGGTTWNSQQTQPEGDSYIYYDGQGTLELHNVTIQGQYDDSHVFGAGIYALCGTKKSVSLTIQLTGNNTITGDFGIYVEAQQGGTLGANASLSITGDGSLTVTGTASYGLYVKSGTGDASLTIKNASVDAKTTQTYSSYAGVCVQSGASATGSPQLSLAVNGGSLTASASEGNDGIQFYVGNSSASATTSLTVSENAIVDARNGGISALKISETLPTPTPTGDNRSGIVFDGKDGTVYGNVELQEDLTIGKDESLTIPDGASLTIGNDATLTNEGTVTNSGTLTNNGTINNSGTLPDNIQGTAPPSITTTSLAGGAVGTAYNATLGASGENITWTWAAVTGSSLPPGLELSTSGVISGTPTAQGTSNFTVTASNNGGSDSKPLSITISSATNIPVQSVSLDKTSLELTEGGTGTLIATVEPNNATNKNVTWASSNSAVATVDATGNVKAVGAGEATITVTTQDGGKTDTCTVTVEKPYTPPPYIPPTKTPSQQAIDKIEDARPGDTVKITLRTGQTKLDKEVFEELAGRDVTLEISLPGGVTWTVNGEDIPKTADLTDLDMGVSLNTSTIPVDLINTITGEVGTVQLTLKHDGPFGFTMTLTAPVGKENEGLWANLYHYDEDAGEMVYQTAAQVDEDGNVALPFDHASQYALVLDSKSHDLPFTDLAANAWYTDAVAYVYRHDIMEGMSATTFQPNGTLSRAMAVQIFYNLEGQPDISGENLGYPYEDVNAQAWYGDAVYWARITGVATGYGDGTFQPGDSITRQEFAQMLYNYAKYKGYDLTAEGDLSQFPDSGSVADWAEIAMSWANGNKLINGHDDGTIDAAGTATRAQAASILMRFDQNLVEK